MGPISPRIVRVAIYVTWAAMAAVTSDSRRTCPHTLPFGMSFGKVRRTGQAVLNVLLIRVRGLCVHDLEKGVKSLARLEKIC